MMLLASWKNTHIHLRPVIGSPELPKDFDTSLQIKSAMERKVEGVPLKQKWSLRRYDLSETDVLVMSVLNEGPNEIFCQFDICETDGLLAIAATKMHEDEPNLKIDQIPTPKNHDPHKGTSLLYIRGNYTLFVDAGVKSSQIERYLNWLLLDSHPDDAGFSIKLSAKFELADGSGTIPNATELKIQPSPVHTPTPLESMIAEQRSKDQQVGQIQSSSSKEKVFEVLTILGLGYERVQKLYEKLGEDSMIEMGVSIKVKRKGKLLPVNAFPIEEMARNFEDDAIKLRGKNGSVVGKLVSVKHPTKIKAKPFWLLTITDVLTIHLTFLELKITEKPGLELSMVTM